MTNCDRLGSCPFFNDRMQNMPASANLMKSRFCLGGNECCARYTVFKAGMQVPADLMPSQMERALAMIPN